jgi:quercetin dioxygenase-like cupin family protein
MGFVRHRRDDGSWDDVVPREYASGASRHVLVGAHDGATQVELRYFTIPVGGASNLEHHPHEHAILISEGHAEVTLGETVAAAGPGDVVFVAANEVHQLRTVGNHPLGFICTALANRSGPPPAA